MSVLLVDGNNLAIRAALAPGQEMDSDGFSTGPLVIFVNSLSRFVRMDKPTNALVAWDSGASAYRTRLFPAYKANRKQKHSDLAQQPIALIQTFLKLAGFPQLQLPGYEGDDIIGASWRACRGRERITILSSDKDMLQLIEENTEQIKLVKSGAMPDRWNRDRFIREMGFKPEYQAYVLALMGDTSDGIPGLPKVGPKTAIKMLTAVDWNMDKLVESLTPEQQDLVLLNLALVDLSCVPLTLTAPPELDLVTPKDMRWPALEKFLDRFELNRIKEKLVSGQLWT